MTLYFSLPSRYNIIKNPALASCFVNAIVGRGQTLPCFGKLDKTEFEEAILSCL